MSGDDGESGTAMQVRYAYLARAYALTVGWTEISDRYATVSLPAQSDRAMRRIDLLTNVRRGKLDVGLNGSIEDRRDLASINRVSLTGTYPLLQRGRSSPRQGWPRGTASARPRSRSA